MCDTCGNNFYESDAASDLRLALGSLRSRLGSVAAARGNQEEDQAVRELVAILISQGRHDEAHELAQRRGLSSPLVEVAWLRVRLALEAMAVEQARTALPAARVPRRPLITSETISSGSGGVSHAVTRFRILGLPIGRGR